MAKQKNYHYHASPEKIKDLVEQYTFIGRYVETPEPDHIVVFAVAPKPEKDKDKDEKRGEKKKTSRKNTFSSNK